MVRNAWVREKALPGATIVVRVVLGLSTCIQRPLERVLGNYSAVYSAGTQQVQIGYSSSQQVLSKAQRVLKRVIRSDYPLC